MGRGGGHQANGLLTRAEPPRLSKHLLQRSVGDTTLVPSSYQIANEISFFLKTSRINDDGPQGVAISVNVPGHVSPICSCLVRMPDEGITGEAPWISPSSPPCPAHLHHYR